MTERIEDPAQAPAVLVSYLGRRNGTGSDRLREHRVRVFDQQQGPASGAADRSWAEPRRIRSAG
jgi:hypothetical protein